MSDEPDLVDRLRHLAVDYGQNEHMPDSAWLTEAADAIERLRTLAANVTEGWVTAENRLRTVVTILSQISGAAAMGDFGWVAKALFVWGQRGDHILDGEETWEDQHMGAPTWAGQGG